MFDAIAQLVVIIIIIWVFIVGPIIMVVEWFKRVFGPKETLIEKTRPSPVEKKHVVSTPSVRLTPYKKKSKSNSQDYSQVQPEIIPDVEQKVSPHQAELKIDHEKYLDCIKYYGIECLYHFTDRSNIQSIRDQEGLLSWKEADRRGVKINYPGGSKLSRELDERDGLGDYVRLCFHPDHPMKFVAQRDGRIPDPVILKISLDVVAWSSTLFSNKNATTKGAIFGGELKHFKEIDFNVLSAGRWTNEDEKHKFQAEVLIETFLPKRYIINLNKV